MDTLLKLAEEIGQVYAIQLHTEDNDSIPFTTQYDRHKNGKWIDHLLLVNEKQFGAKWTAKDLVSLADIEKEIRKLKDCRALISVVVLWETHHDY